MYLSVKLCNSCNDFELVICFCTKDIQSLKSEFEEREEKYDFQQDERFDEIQAEIRERDERLNYQSDQKLMELRNDLQAMETKMNTLQHHQVYNMDIAQICFHHFFTKIMGNHHVTVWKNAKLPTYHRNVFFREIISLVSSLVKMLLSRNFCQK